MFCLNNEECFYKKNGLDEVDDQILFFFFSKASKPYKESKDLPNHGIDLSTLDTWLSFAILDAEYLMWIFILNSQRLAYKKFPAFETHFFIFIS